MTQMTVSTKEIGICLLHRNNRDVDVQMIQETNQDLIIQSFHQKSKASGQNLVGWVVDNMPEDYKSFKICLSHGGTELYPVYTKLTLMGANVAFCGS